MTTTTQKTIQRTRTTDGAELIYWPADIDPAQFARSGGGSVGVHHMTKCNRSVNLAAVGDFGPLYSPTESAIETARQLLDFAVA